MKQLLGSLCLLLTMLTTASAQSPLFLDLGYNHSNLKTGQYTTSYGSGYYGGLHFEDLISERFELSTAMRFSKMGVFALGENQSFNFLDASFSVGSRPVPEMTLQAGLGISRLLNKKTLIERDFDSGIHFGVKYNFKNVFIKANYYRGLIDQSPNTQDVSLYTQNFQLGIGLRLAPGKKSVDEPIIIIRTAPSVDNDTLIAKIDTNQVEQVHVPYYRNYVGLTLSSFNRFNFLYKKSLQPTLFLRIGLLTSNFTFESSSFTSSNDGSIGLDIGIEWLKKIDDKGYFIHGPSIVLSSDFLRDPEISSEVDLGLRYNMGYYYKLADRFDVGGELSPQFTYSNANNRETYNLNLSTQGVRLVLIYKLGMR